LGVVKEFNGDVIKFCGDAVMIMWPVPSTATPGVKAATAYLAASCAMKLISDCGTYSKQEKGYKVLLRLHCGIGSGLVHCMCLGVGDRWEFLISGDPLRQVGIAESEAGIGEVCMAEESYSLVSEHFESIEMPEGSRNLIFSKQTKKTRGGGGAPPVTESPYVLQEKLQIPLETDLLNKLTNEQSRLNVASPMTPLITTADGLKITKSPTLSPGKKNLEVASPFSDEDKSGDISHVFHQQTSQDSKISEDKDTVGSPTDRSSVERSPLSIPTPSSKRQSFFSPMFGQSPMTTTPDPSIDRELKRNISAAKAYLGDFTCSGYIPPWNIVPYLHKFLMDPAKMAIENDTLNYVAELREVVTIFIEILGLEDDFNMGFVRRPQRVIAIVIDCLDRFSGSLRQYVVDDKGCVIIAAFGLPGSSHEDNCVRAIEAATLIRDNFTEVKIECRIGIAKGMVYCGLVGSDDRCEYAMMGSSVNLAARLMGKGENGNILVNQDVQVATEKVFKFQALQKINAKGYVKPVAVFIPYERIQTHELSTHKSRLDSMGLNFAMLGGESEMKGEGGTNHATNGSGSPKHLKKPKFIGRQTELATFQRSLEIFVSQDLDQQQPQKSGRRAGGGVDASSQGGGQTQQAHIVEGAAGAGKTWFVQEVIRMAKRMNGIQQIYICAATGQTQKSSQFYIIGQLMEQIFGISIMNTLMKGPEAGGRMGTPKGNASAVAQAAGVSMSMAPKRNATRDHIVAWFEKFDPDGRIISSKLISRDTTASAGGGAVGTGGAGGLFESSNGLTTRKSLLVRGGSVAKFGRQLQKASSVDTISSLEIATGSSAYASASSQLRKRMFASAKVSGEFVNDSHAPPSSGSLGGGGIPEEIAEESAAEEFETKEFHYSHLLPLLSDILPVQIEDNLITASLSFTDRKTYCEALIMYILEVALERQRTLLVVENIHWCDCSSLTYLTHWLQKKTGCFFLCTSRTCGESNATTSPHLVDMASCQSSPLASTVPASGRRRSQSGRGSSEGTGSSSSHHRKKALKMEPKFQDMDVAHVLSELYQLCASTALHFFSPEEIVTLLKSILGPTLLSQFPLVLNRENVEKIKSHTDGSPILTHILAVELEDALRKGIFRSVDDLPSGTDALILSRFDKLTTRDQIILKVASVWGQSFTTTDLYSVLYRLGDLNSSAGLADALTALVNSNLIQPTAAATATAGGGRGEAGSVRGAGEGGQTPHNDSGEMLIVETNTAYSFVNRSIQDGIYYLMLETQRKQTHGVIGSLLEEKLETIGFNPLLFLAVTNHYMRSDLTAKKFEFLVRSAHLAKSTNDNYIANSHYGELIFMKTDRSVGDLLAESTTTTSSSTAQRGRILGGVLFSSSSSQQQHQLHPQQQLSRSRYRLSRQESMANIFETDGFGTDRKWVRVNELKSRFQTREFISHKTICVWIGEVARARFK
jgi:class 3 adenylate cyclase